MMRSDLLERLWKPLAELRYCPRALWYIVGAFVVDSMAYFGVLTLMTIYFSRDLGWSDAYASITVSMFTMLVTLFMLGVGSVAESFGLRRAIVAALVLALGGRALYCGLPAMSSPTVAIIAALLSLLLVAAGEGILQPTCYSGVKQFTNARTSSMGYAMIYALMNLGIVGIGAVSAWVRPGVQELLDNPGLQKSAAGPLHWLASVCGSGVQAVNSVCFGVTALTLLLFAALMTPAAEQTRLRPDVAPTAADPRPSLAVRCRNYLIEGPLGNARFVFFIFMLLPVRTLFAHQWLTMPEYILRAYPQGVGDKMEWLVNWINPLIIFVAVPLATALTRRVHVYTLMIVGSLVSAAPTFLLCFGPDLKLLLTYFVLFSIGEAIWSARFLEYASELAPPGRVAQYMGLAQIPWLLAKGTTGLYSGYLLATYCPPTTPADELHTGTLWLIYGLIAMTSPIGLWLARGWVQRGLQQPASDAALAPAAPE